MPRPSLPTALAALTLAAGTAASSAIAQDLSEIEGWVFEPVFDPNGQPLRGDLIHVGSSTTLAGSAQLIDQNGTIRFSPFIVRDGIAEALALPAGAQDVFITDVDSRGIIYGSAAASSDGATLPKPFTWVDTVPSEINTGRFSCGTLHDVLPDGRAVGLVSMCDPGGSTNLRQRSLAIWDDVMLVPMTFPPLIFPAAETTGRNGGFVPTGITPDGSVVGANLDAVLRTPLSLGWRLPDGTLREITVDDAAGSDRSFLTIWPMPYGPGQALATAIRINADALVIDAALLRITTSGAELLESNDDPFHFELATNPAGLTAIGRGGVWTLGDGESERILKEATASARRTATFVGDIAADGMIVTWDGILRLDRRRLHRLDRCLPRS